MTYSLSSLPYDNANACSTHTFFTMSASCDDFLATREKSPNIVFHKVCLVGNSGVGKSTLFMRLKTGRYIDATQATLTEDTHRYTHIVDDIEVSVSDNNNTKGEHALSCFCCVDAHSRYMWL